MLSKQHVMTNSSKNAQGESYSLEQIAPLILIVPNGWNEDLTNKQAFLHGKIEREVSSANVPDILQQWWKRFKRARATFCNNKYDDDLPRNCSNGTPKF